MRPFARPEKPLVASLLLAFSAGVCGHSGEMDAAGFASGVLHPLSGPDHVLVMLAAGIWTSRLRAAALWLLPLGFAGMMVAGAAFSLYGGSLPAPELAIALSLAVMGIVLVGRCQLKVFPALVMVGTFAFFHGYVHAEDLADPSELIAYGGGFSLSSLLLQGFGMGLGFAAKTHAPTQFFRLFGIACAGFGVYLLAS